MGRWPDQKDKRAVVCPHPRASKKLLIHWHLEEFYDKEANTTPSSEPVVFIVAMLAC